MPTSRDFIKKLKASSPDFIGPEAAEKYSLALKGIREGSQKYFVYHSSIMGMEACAEQIGILMSQVTKIAKNEKEFVYSYQPYAIMYFEVPIIDGDITFPNDNIVGKSINMWAMMYSNCIITYAAMENFEDLSALVLDNNDQDE